MPLPELIPFALRQTGLLRDTALAWSALHAWLRTVRLNSQSASVRRGSDETESQQSPYQTWTLTKRQQRQQRRRHDLQLRREISQSQRQRCMLALHVQALRLQDLWMWARPLVRIQSAQVELAAPPGLHEVSNAQLSQVIHSCSPSSDKKKQHSRQSSKMHGRRPLQGWLQWKVRV